MTDYIRKAVELADGFNMDEQAIVVHGWQDFCFIDDPDRHVLDCLAAQLVRQVDALDRGAFHCEPNRGIVCEVATHFPFAHKTVEVAEGPDRTMNTLRAIVDSGVLDRH